MIRHRIVRRSQLPQIIAAAPAKATAAVSGSSASLAGEIRQTITSIGAVDTGLMRDSTQEHHDGLRDTVTTDAPYWRHINDGVHDRAARPFVEPSAAAEMPKFVRRLVRVIEP